MIHVRNLSYPAVGFILLRVLYTALAESEPQFLDGSIRLVDGETEWDGRVEISMNWVWGTVCDDGWTTKEADVVCHQLGYGPAVEALPRAHFGEGRGSIMMDDVICTGREERLIDCRFSSTSDCDHGEDASVVCTQIATGDVRLVNGDNPHEGRLEIYLGGGWATVCDDDWRAENTDVVCSQLGYGRGLEYVTSTHFGVGERRIAMGDVVCSGPEKQLSDCSYTSDHNCAVNGAIGIRCDVPEAGNVRLLGGHGPHEGRVEIYLHDEWGAVCDAGWDLPAARVVCKQLGYSGALSAVRRAAFGKAEDPSQMDDVVCGGEEATLMECSHTARDKLDCGHENDAGVVCKTSEHASVRLAGGNSSAGRVEIFLDGQWGTVCDDLWDKADADVICRMLGFREAHAAHGNAFFGAGVEPTHLDDVECRGSETNIMECPLTRDENCNHYEDAGVTCVEKKDDSVRLAGGNSTAGRVEIFLDGQWGTICDDFWDKADADVICRMLGFREAHAAHGNAFFGAGVEPTHLDNVECSGSETNIMECPLVRDENCNHYEDAGVTCMEQALPPVSNLPRFREDRWCGVDWLAPNGEVAQCDPDGSYPCCSSDNWCGIDPAHCNCDECVDYRTDIVPENGAIRLAGGNITAGRVEVYLNGEWGTVCDDSWDIVDANVACRWLGFPSALSALGGAFFGEGVGLTQMDDVDCYGRAPGLINCSYTDSMSEDCGHHEDAGVVCFTGIEVPTGTGPARFREDTQCGSGWLAPNGEVAECDPNGIYPCCAPSNWCGITTYHCDCDDCLDYRKVQPVSPEPTFLEAGTVRLANGNSTVGRVEVYLNGGWGTVCDDDWDMSDANVVCRQLGFERALSATKEAYFREGDGPIQMDDVACSGDEERLIDCAYLDSSAENCGHHEDAGVKCLPIMEDPGTLRLVNGNDTAGRLEVFLFGEWGTVCGDSWDVEDANVACRQLGFASATSATSGALFGQGSGRTQMDDVECTGTEDSLVRCRYRDFSVQECTHSQDAGVVCFPGTDLPDYRDDHRCGIGWLAPSGEAAICDQDSDSPCCSPEGQCGITTEHCSCPDCIDYRSGSVRLANGNETTGRVELFLDGEWGSVCADRWDIEDANVACRQLGFANAIFALEEGFGREGTIHMENVICRGDEDRLIDCSYINSTYAECFHSEGAAVMCSPRIEERSSFRNDNRCGGDWLAPNGQIAVCDPDGRYPCCSPTDQCGITDDHCRCENCTDFRGIQAIPELEPARFREDRRCGGGFLGPHRGIAECDPNGAFPCCAPDKYCGITPVHCNCELCTDYRFYGAPAPWPRFREDNQCGGDWLAPNGEMAECDPNSDNPCCSSENRCGLTSGHCDCEGCIDYREVPDVAAGSLRLVGGNTMAGRLEVFLTGEWGTVCDDFWHIEDANVACRSLGFANAISAPRGAFFGEGEGPVNMDDLHCSGTEDHLTDCHYLDTANCGHDKDASAVCFPGTDDPSDSQLYREDNRCGGDWRAPNGHVAQCDPNGIHPCCSSANECGITLSHCICAGCVDHRFDSVIPSGTLRIVGGNETEGRLEVYLNSEWGTICDDFWKLEDASVACRQLGFASALDAPGGAYFGQGQGPTQMDDLHCFGNESSLTDCPYKSSVEENCEHNEDAGVVCFPSVEVPPGPVRFRSDRRCGGSFTAPNGELAVCDINGVAPCCSLDHRCGITFSHCNCNGCIDYRKDAITGGAVTEMNMTNPIADGSLQLGHGDRLEIFLSGHWRSVCLDGFTVIEGDVACRELGFEGIARLLSTERLEGSLRVSISDVRCTGTEDRLVGCASAAVSECLQSGDVVLECKHR